MGARQKLNSSHVNGCLVVAGGVAYWMQSWIVFFLLLAILVACSVHSGAIRPGRRGS
ncbi:MAG: hypothetical protein IID44_20700 [Planctomycetes bacterium]|nr:hypothetical protein [Planctomycetota bacterium]